MEGYEELLNNAYKTVKPIEKDSERFEIPRVEGMIEGNKTIVTNFTQICSYLRRDCNHVAKFLNKELAAAALIDGTRLILNRKIMSSKINEKIALYVKDFVVCKECGKPDTELVKQERFLFMHCLACGAKHSLSSKI